MKGIFCSLINVLIILPVGIFLNGFYMKKLNNNNKFRGNGNTIYSLNYKFDSVSSAGKLSGTALDLIKKYNELAKEAHNNGDYVQMEVFRQYAEHYRKIVTDINERKNQNRDSSTSEQQSAENNDTAENKNEEQKENETPENTNLVETQAAVPPADTASPAEKNPAPAEKTRKRRSFTVIDIASKEKAETEEKTETFSEPTKENASNEDASAEKPRRRVLNRRRTAKQQTETAED